MEGVATYNPFASHYSLVTDLPAIFSAQASRADSPPASQLQAPGLSQLFSSSSQFPHLHLSTLASARSSSSPLAYGVSSDPLLGRPSQPLPAPAHSLWNQPSLLDGVQHILGPAPQRPVSYAPSGSRFSFLQEEHTDDLDGFQRSSEMTIVGSLNLDSPALNETPMLANPVRSSSPLSGSAPPAQKWTPFGLPSAPGAPQTWAFDPRSSISQQPPIPRPSSPNSLWKSHPQPASSSYVPFPQGGSGLGLFRDSPTVSAARPPRPEPSPMFGSGLGLIGTSQGFGGSLPSASPFSLGSGTAGGMGGMWSFASSGQPPKAAPMPSSSGGWSMGGGGYSEPQRLPSPSSSDYDTFEQSADRFPLQSRYSVPSREAAPQLPLSRFISPDGPISRSTPPPADDFPSPLPPSHSLQRSHELFPQHHQQQSQHFLGPSSPQKSGGVRPLIARPNPRPIPFPSLQKSPFVDAWDDQGEGSNVTSTLQSPFSVGLQPADHYFLRSSSSGVSSLPTSRGLHDFDSPDLNIDDYLRGGLSADGLYGTSPTFIGNERSPSPVKGTLLSATANEVPSFSQTHSATGTTEVAPTSTANGAAKGKKKKKGNQPEHSPPTSPPPPPSQLSSEVPLKPKPLKQQAPPNPAPVPEELLALQRVRQQQETHAQAQREEAKQQQAERVMAARKKDKNQQATATQEQAKAPTKATGGGTATSQALGTAGATTALSSVSGTTPASKKEKKREDREVKQHEERAGATGSSNLAALEQEVANAKREAQLLESQLKAIMELTGEM